MVILCLIQSPDFVGFVVIDIKMLLLIYFSLRKDQIIFENLGTLRDYYRV